MLLKIISCENKTKDWKIVGYKTPEGGEVAEASVNRMDRSKVVQFPNFDAIVEGSEMEGNPWRNPTNGKWSIFPPKPEKPQGGVKFNATGASKLMDKKIESIEKSQEVKGEAIKLTTSMQLAVSCAIAEYAKPNSLDTLETLITKYRTFILTNWEVGPTDVAPF